VSRVRIQPQKVVFFDFLPNRVTSIWKYIDTCLLEWVIVPQRHCCLLGRPPFWPTRLLAGGYPFPHEWIHKLVKWASAVMALILRQHHFCIESDTMSSRYRRANRKASPKHYKQRELPPPRRRLHLAQCTQSPLFAKGHRIGMVFLWLMLKLRLAVMSLVNCVANVNSRN
jgi:hypothetical protein